MFKLVRSLAALGGLLLAVLLVGSLAATASGTYPVRPGQVGDAKVGMTVRQAMRTGQFIRDVKFVVPGVCTKIIKLQPKGDWKDRYDVIVQDGRIKEMGVFAKLPRTVNGSGVGTTLGTLRDRYGLRLSAPREAGFGQWAVFVHSQQTGADRRWVGFLLGHAFTNERAARLSDVVTFMAVTKGRRPELIRSGC